MNGILTIAGKPFFCSPVGRNTARFPAGAPSARVSTQLHAVAVKTERPKSASLYEVLGLDETASFKEIKSAYRSLAKVYHPDADCGSDGRDSMDIHKAYSTLSDPTARKGYDLSLSGSRRLPRRVDGTAAYGRSRAYASRRWETDQCW